MLESEGVVLLGLVDEVAFQISKVLEAVFDEIEYRVAKHEHAKRAKQNEKAQRRALKSSRGTDQFQNAPPQRQTH